MRLRVLRCLIARLYGPESAHPKAALRAIALAIDEEERR